MVTQNSVTKSWDGYDIPKACQNENKECGKCYLEKEERTKAGCTVPVDEDEEKFNGFKNLGDKKVEPVDGPIFLTKKQAVENAVDAVLDVIITLKIPSDRYRETLRKLREDLND